MRLAYWGLVAGALCCTAMAKDTTRESKVQAALARELAGLTPGTPQSCLNTFETRNASAQSFGDTLVYRTTGSRRYVTVTTGCTDIGGNGDNILITKTFSTQLCRGDIATTVDRTSHFFSGSCSFGDFVPYTRAPGAALPHKPQ